MNAPVFDPVALLHGPDIERDAFFALSGLDALKKYDAADLQTVLPELCDLVQAALDIRDKAEGGRV